jgi:hypothetical protein
MAGHSKAWQGMARHDTARRSQPRQGKAGILHKRKAELDGTSAYSPNSCRQPKPQPDTQAEAKAEIGREDAVRCSAV